MTSKTKTLIDALADHVRGLSLSQPVEVWSGFFPMTEIEKKDQNRFFVDVFAGPRTFNSVFRESMQREFTVFASVYSMRDTEAAEDQVVALGEEIEEQCWDTAFGDFRRGETGEVVQPPFIPEELEVHNMVQVIVPMVYVTFTDAPNR